MCKRTPFKWEQISRIHNGNGFDTYRAKVFSGWKVVTYTVSCGEQGTREALTSIFVEDKEHKWKA